MCLPCFTEVFIEEELPRKKKKEEVLLYTVWDGKARRYVKVPKAMIPPPHPVIYQQPYITQPQPMYAAGSGFAPPYYDIQQQPYPATGYPNFSIHQPDHGATYGYTGGEMLMQNMGQAVHPDFTKKQEMQPSDPDQFRMYWCREPDNTWTQRNRLTIESGDIGDCRWYATDGQFYAVRLT